MSFDHKLLASFDVHNGVLYQKDLARPGDFEKRYVQLREKENRLYRDEIVKRLPRIPVDHPTRNEWHLRKICLDELVSHLEKRGQCKSILEVGCGNGWLSHALVTSLGAGVCALDINEIELNQGARVFKSDDLTFVYADIFTVPFNGYQFDTIILASATQYFADVPRLLSRLLELLTPTGRIYLVDSPWYSEATVGNARARSRAYFDSIGFPEMADNYFHHTWSALVPFNFEIFFNPNSLASLIERKLLMKQRPHFPWIVIKPRYR
jgi:SAM-dependent methyltransferase